MGYERKNKKNRLASQVVCRTSQTAFLSFLRADAGKGRFDPAPNLSSVWIITYGSVLRKKMSTIREFP
jgi:hypothetical protein